MGTLIAKPELPSSVVYFQGDQIVSLPPSFNETEAIIGTHDWGPIGGEDADALKVRGSLPEFEAVFGTGDTPGRTAVVGAFHGQGAQGAGGAGGVIFYRAATAAAARASLVRQNTTPANALTLTARWKGTRGNAISIVIEDDPVDAAKDRLRVLFNGATVETYSYEATDIASLAARITARSSLLTATSQVTGVALTATAGVSLAGGNDGAVLTAAEYLTAQDALEFASFGILSPAALETVAIKVQLAVWAVGMAAEMRPIRLVLGGAAGETVDDVITELDTNPELRDPHIIRFGVGTYHDDLLDKDLSTAELAPRIGGILAARGEKSALTRALLGGLSLVGATGASTDELKAGRDSGVTMLRRVSHAEAELAVSQGVNTYIDDTEAQPYALWSEPRLIGLLDRILRQLVGWGDDVVIGDLPVNDDTRNEVRKEVLKVLGQLEGSGLAVPGTVFASVDPPSDPGLEDAIPYTFGFKPTRTANYMIGNGRIR